MNAMMDANVLRKYLAGNASEEESRQCEIYLSEIDKPVHEAIEEEIGCHAEASDSLLDTLRGMESQQTVTQVDQLVNQIQQMVPAHTIGSEELNRILAPLEADDALGMIDHYRVIEYIASGGMGVVFKAEDTKLNRLVCIKVLNPMLASNAESKARFARETKSAARLRSNRIVTVLGLGEHRDLPYLVMQLLDGQSLRKRMDLPQRMLPQEIKKIVVQVAQGLQYAHSLGYLHRDIKPENIWITTEGDIKLLDFGLARAVDETANLTQTGTIIGTPNYMSPEQVQGKELDARSDLFSLGTVYFEMHTQKCPFDKPNLFSTMMSIANDRPQMPDVDSDRAVPVQVQPIMEGLLKKDPNERIQSAQQLIQQLNSIDEMSKRTVQTRPSLFRTVVNHVALLLLGAAMAMSGWMAYQLTDKGTIVVQADPSVEINVQNEAVTVFDPVTNRRFEIEIGTTQLPSGVYQLELADPKGDYKLSSDVITIHRGDEKIVTLELKPAVNKTGANAKSDSSTGFDADPTKLESPNTALDPTHARRPSLSAAQLRKDFRVTDWRISNTSLMHRPRPREGITSWAIEPICQPRGTKVDLKINADGRRLSTTDEHSSFARIWDANNELTHLIPGQAKRVWVRWSPDPNVFALIERGDKVKQVSVWELRERHAEVLQVIAVEAQDVAWSWDGERVAVVSNNKIGFYDLGVHRNVARTDVDISGEITRRPWSFKHRYFATSWENDVIVWDLETGKPFHVFAGAERGQFLPDRNSIAIYKEDDDLLEIWNLDSFELEARHDVQSGYRGRPNDQFTRYLAIGKTFEVCEFGGGERHVVGFEAGAFHPITKSLGSDWNRHFRRHGTAQWSGDGSAIVISNYQHRNFIVRTAGDGKPVAGWKPLPNFQLSSTGLQKAFLRPGGRLVYLDKRIFGTEEKPEEKLVLVIANVNSAKVIAESDFSFVHDEVVAVSPDGRWTALASSNIGRDQSNSGLDKNIELQRDLREIKIVSNENGRVAQQIIQAAPVIDLKFSANSESLVVTTSRRRDENLQAKSWQRRSFLYRVDNAKQVDLEIGDLSFYRGRGKQATSGCPLPVVVGNQVAVPLFDSETFLPNGFRSKTGKQAGRDHICVFDTETGELVEKIKLAGPISGSLLDVNDRAIIVSTSSGEACIAFDRKTQIQRTIPMPNVVHASIAPNHDEIWTLHRQSVNSDLTFKSWNLSNNDQVLTFSKSLGIPRPAREFDGQPFSWHSTGPWSGFISGNRLQIHKHGYAGPRKEVEIPDAAKAIFADEGDWVVVYADKLCRYNSEGSLTRTTLISEPFDGDFYSSGSFDQVISTDGVYLDNPSKTHLRVIQLNGNRFETLTMEEFEKAARN